MRGHIMDNEIKKRKMRTLDDAIEVFSSDDQFRLFFAKEIEINQIATLIYKLRLSSGLTQTELADKANITQPVLARLESGKDTRVPTLKLLLKVAQATGKRLTLNFV
tara:strand:- start:18 stop:338 length:321 start_codon:yes stop_codon:yes gene_type:complete